MCLLSCVWLFYPFSFFSFIFFGSLFFGQGGLFEKTPHTRGRSKTPHTRGRSKTPHTRGRLKTPHFRASLRGSTKKTGTFEKCSRFCPHRQKYSAFPGYKQISGKMPLSKSQNKIVQILCSAILQHQSNETRRPLSHSKKP